MGGLEVAVGSGSFGVDLEDRSDQRETRVERDKDVRHAPGYALGQSGPRDQCGGSLDVERRSMSFIRWVDGCTYLGGEGDLLGRPSEQRMAH